MVQETTFNSAYQADGSENIFSIHQWLTALYTQASHKKIDQTHFNHLISTLPSFNLLEVQLNYTFQNRAHLAQAFMQSTFCYEMKDVVFHSNERLEFLGDSLLNFMVAEVLYEKYPDKNEGELSKLRGALVNEAELSKFSRALGLEDNIFLGKGEFKSNGHLKDSILADTFESLLGAVYIDSGKDLKKLRGVFDTIVAFFEKKSGNAFFSDLGMDHFDSKSRLQELTVARRGVFPVYKSIPEGQEFRVEVWIDEKMIASMTGPSKKKTEKELARKILTENLY